MKKLLVLLLLMIYGSATMGATVHFHYCMNKVVGWSLVSNQDHQCRTCGMEKKDSCCKDSKAQIKIAADQQKSESTNAAALSCPSLDAHPIVSDYFFSGIPELEFIPLPIDSPPSLPQLEKPEFLCVFRV